MGGMFQDVTVEELLELQRKGDAALIDVRSPAEFADATIPGSVNLPLFDDAERAEVGTLYKQESVEAAKVKGLELVSRKLPSYIQAIGATDGKHKIVFCWRGGMRSKTSATLADLMGIRMYRLIGGFRAYRRWVVEQLELLEQQEPQGQQWQQEQPPQPQASQRLRLPPCYVINGYTGTGKTHLLARLAAEGYPVLDLEQLAGHRGSIFGHIGQNPRNQKAFEALLVHELRRLSDAPYMILEAESRRIGKVVLPQFLLQAKQRGTVLHVELPLKERVAHIVRDYKPGAHHEDSLQSFRRIAKRLHTPIAAEIREALQQQDYERAIGLLLVHYYDPRYAHASSQYTTAERQISIGGQTLDDVYRALIGELPQ